jgi:AcrR family transcriptional regulator
MTAIPFSFAFRGAPGESRQILKTAAGMLAQKGYHQTTVEEIARALGVAKGTIYYHFKNKEELYLAIIQEGVCLLEEQMVLNISGAKTAPEKIKKIIGGMLAFIENESDLVFLFIKELCGTDIQRDVLAKMLSGSLGLIRGIIDEGTADGSFSEVNPEITASSLYGMIAVTALHYLSYAKSIPHNEVKTAVEQVFFKGILWPDCREGL